MPGQPQCIVFGTPGPGLEPGARWHAPFDPVAPSVRTASVTPPEVDHEAAEGLGTECRRLLPSATKTARIGADLTAVVTGTPSARPASLLDSVADRETNGTASAPASAGRRSSAGSARHRREERHEPVPE